MRAENDGTLTEILVRLFAQKPATEWLDVLLEAGVPVSLGQVNEELLNDPHCLENSFFEERDHPLLGRVRHHGVTPRFSDMTGIIRRTGPLLGQHTEEVLTELGYTREEIEGLVKERVAFLTEESEQK
jgi:crotonobetainyl-CoA:carnitine CoA-transferase CaiB-like acyl-CoA transferase